MEEVIKEEVQEEPKELDMIDRAKLAAQDLNAALDRKQKLIEREERLMAEKKLGGSSSAGTTTEEKKVETPAEYTKRVMGGKL